MPRLLTALVALLAAAAITTGCGSSNSSSSSSSANPKTASGGQSPSSTAGGAGALTTEAQSAATGDIPDNQVYLRFANRMAGYAIRYPEGWTRKGGTNDVTFADKNNIIHVAVVSGPAPTVASVAGELAREQHAKPSLTFTPPRSVTLKSGPAIKSTYMTKTAPNPVTGKVITLVVDRYELARGGKVATVDLGTPKGVDTVDAYRMIINSFQWQ